MWNKVVTQGIDLHQQLGLVEKSIKLLFLYLVSNMKCLEVSQTCRWKGKLGMSKKSEWEDELEPTSVFHYL